MADSWTALFPVDSGAIVDLAWSSPSGSSSLGSSTYSFDGSDDDDEVDTYDLQRQNPDYSIYEVYGNGGDDNLSASILTGSRSDFLSGGDGNDFMSGFAGLGSQGAVVVSGGYGTDEFFASLSRITSDPQFSRTGEDSTTFTVSYEDDSSSLEVSVADDVEYITFKGSDGAYLYYLTEDLANGITRPADFDEVYARAYGDNADWFLKSLDTGNDTSSDPPMEINDVALGTIKGSYSNGGEILDYSGLINSLGLIDGLRFSLDSDAYTYFGLTDFTSDLDLYLYRDNPDGEENDLLYTSEAIGLEDESFFKYLSAGDYAAFVAPYDALPENGCTYTLEIDTQTFLRNTFLPNDPLFANQWHLFNTGQGTGADNDDILAPEAWFYQSTSPDITVAVIDGGVDLDHPDLKENIWVNTGETPSNGVDDDSNGYIDDINGWNFYYNSNIINVTSNGDDHGTHVAGIIGARGNNGIGVSGVTWETQIMSLTVFEAYEPGAGDILSAIYYAVDNGAKVINLSLGLDYEGTVDSYIAEFPADHQAYLQALNYAVNNGTTVVIAAGNDNNSFDANWISSPAYFSDLIPGVISVAAAANNEQKAGYSNYGSLVTITAPGGDFYSSGDGIVEDGLFSTYPLQPQEEQEILFDNGYGYMNGTSMAAPVVSGAVALLLQKYPSLTPAQVEEALVNSASTSRDLDGVSRNGGYLNLRSLLSYYDNISTPSDTPSNTAPTRFSITVSAFDENINGGTTIGTLTSTDADAGDTFTYSLISGTGDTDNGSFTIDGAQLKINASPDYETKSSYSIRVRTTDAGGLFYEDVLVLGVNDLTETPAGGDGAPSSGGSSGSTSSGGSGGSSSTPSPPPSITESTVPTTTPSTEPATTSAPTSPVPPTPSQESPVLSIQPQAAVTTVQLAKPLTLGTQQITQAVVGTPERDVITGSDDGEALAGGKGKDQMTGRDGPDAFIFETTGEFGKQNADVITDFDPAQGDRIVIASEAFDGATKIRFKSVTGKKEVKSMAKSNTNFIYDDKSGMLYYDANGKKNGFGPGGEFAQLLGIPEIGKTDFIIV